MCMQHQQWPVLMVTKNWTLCEQLKKEWEMWINNVKILIVKSETMPVLGELPQDFMTLNPVVCLTTYDMLGKPQVHN